MTLDQADKKSLSDIRIAKAYEFLEDAEANLKDGRRMTSINRSYYAALNAVRSILILEGVNPETHEGTVTMLSLRFIKRGLLPVDVIKKFKILFSRRTDVDYGDIEIIDKADTEHSVRIAKELIKVIDKVRKKMIAEQTS